MANIIQAQVTDQSHGHTYNIHPGGTLNQNIGARVGSSDAPETSTTRKALRPHRRCPAPSVHYARRESLENHMDTYFFQDQRGQKRYVLHGLGGAGKTEAAKAFAYRHYYDIKNPGERRFSDVFWVDATSTRTLTDSLQEIAEAVDIKVDDALAWFANRDGDNSNWVILFNNADDPQLDLSTYFPDCSHGNILITTRSQEAKQYGIGRDSAYGVGSMTASESQDVLLNHLRLEDPSTSSVIDDIADLAQELGHFPLSLGQAGAFIAKMHFTPKKYLTMLRTRREQLLAEQGKMKHPDKYEYTSIQAAWLISFETLSTAAKQLLWFCAFLHHDGIPQTIFEYMCTGLDNYEWEYSLLLTVNERAVIGHLKEFRQHLTSDGSWNEFKFHSLITELQSYSLISFIPERAIWSIHPLVHKWARNTMDEDKQIAMRQQVLVLLSSARGRTVEEGVFDGLLAVHVDQALKGAMVAFNGCLSELGLIYWAAGRWDDGVVLERRYKEACERTLGHDHLKTLQSMSNLAATYRNQGRLDDAATLELEVMSVLKKKLGHDHLQTLQSMSNLASTYRKQGRLDDAATLELEVMSVLKKKLGHDHLKTLESMSNLAATYWKQGRLDDAATLDLEVMSVLKKKLGHDHLETLESMSNLATTYWKQGRLDDAATLDLEVMSVLKKKLGHDHLKTLESMSNLASTYRKQGRLDDAATLELEVMSVLKKKLGHDHLKTLESMSNLATTYCNQGRLDDAATLDLEVMSVLKKKLGRDHLQTLRSMSSLATAYWKQDRLDEAVTLQSEVLLVRKRKLGHDHIHTLQSMANLSTIFWKQSRFKEAATLESCVMTARKRKHGEGHLTTLQSMSNLATIYCNQGQLEDAAALQIRVIDTWKRQFGFDHLNTLRSTTNLAITYRKQGRFDDAFSLQSQVVQGLKEKFGDEHSATRQALQFLHCIRRDIGAGNRMTVNPLTPYTLSNQNIADSSTRRRESTPDNLEERQSKRRRLSID